LARIEGGRRVGEFGRGADVDRSLRLCRGRPQRQIDRGVGTRLRGRIAH
jgi:hypothetical protein